MERIVVKVGLSHVLRIVPGLLVLTATLYLVNPLAVARRVSHFDGTWVALGVLLSVPNYLLLAMRWRFVADRLGVPIPILRSISEYYLAGFANHALPTGLAGAGLRVFRHAGQRSFGGEEVGMGRALAAVVLERLAGLAALSLFALLAALLMMSRHWQISVIAAAAVLLLSLVSIGVFSLTARRSVLGRDVFVAQTKLALWRRDAWPLHLLISALSVLLLCLEFFCAARALGIELSLVRSLLVTPLILSSMVIPLSVAGWGVREAASAALFAALGLDGSSGVSVSIAFGLIGLVASLPGALVWIVPQALVTTADSARRRE